jgi:tetrahydromethanopterin S-methyltransferase subunit G
MGRDEAMAELSLEERVANLEGRIEGFGERFDHLERRIEAVDQKVDRFRGELAARIDSLDQKVDRFRGELAARIDSLDQKISRQFIWLVGIQLAVLLAVVGALVGR